MLCLTIATTCFVGTSIWKVYQQGVVISELERTVKVLTANIDPMYQEWKDRNTLLFSVIEWETNGGKGEKQKWKLLLPPNRAYEIKINK
jgi:hypothetical protein